MGGYVVLHEGIVMICNDTWLGFIVSSLAVVHMKGTKGVDCVVENRSETGRVWQHTHTTCQCLCPCQVKSEDEAGECVSLGIRLSNEPVTDVVKFAGLSCVRTMFLEDGYLNSMSLGIFGVGTGRWHNIFSGLV